MPIMWYRTITTKDYAHSFQTQPSAASAMLAKLGLGMRLASLLAIFQLDRTHFFRNLFAYLSKHYFSVHRISFSIEGMTLKL